MHSKELNDEKLKQLPSFVTPVCTAVVFVIDSCHRDRLMEAHSELAKLLTEKELRDALLLIFANKQVTDRQH